MLWFTVLALAHPRETDIDVLVRVDVRGTATSIEAVHALVKQLTPAERRTAKASLQYISVSDPYARAGLQLPYAMQRVVQDLPAEHFDRLVRQDWVTLQRGLDTHIAVLDALGNDLTVPHPGEPLFGMHDFVDRAELSGVDDPLAVTDRFIASLPDIANRVDLDALPTIEKHGAHLESLTGHRRNCPRGPWAPFPGSSWYLASHLAGWHDALRRVQPFVRDAAAQKQVDTLVETLDHWAEVQVP